MTSISIDPNKDNISWLAYYDFSTFVSDSQYDSNELNSPAHAGELNTFDDGVSFTYTHPNVKRDFTVRAGKNEKWITAHMNRKETYTQDSKTDISKFNSINSYPELNHNDLKGDYDIMPWDVQDSGRNARGLNQNTLYSTIKDCLNQTSFWNSDDYNPRDLGLNNYKFGGSNVSVFSESNSGGYSFTYTKNTTIKEAYLVSSLYGDTSLQGYDFAHLDLQGKRIAGQGGGSDYIALDITQIVLDNREISVSMGNDGNYNSYSIIIWE